jgi:hypothetical protein
MQLYHYRPIETALLEIGNGTLHYASFEELIPVCDLCKTGRLSMPYQLGMYAGERMIPNVDGVWFPSQDGLRGFQLLRLFNNGSVELKYNLNTRTNKNEEYLISYEFIDAIENIIKGTEIIYKELGRKSTVFVCVSILGCKGYWNYDSSDVFRPVPSRIDRDRILCSPIEIKDISDIAEVKEMIEECKKMTRYALGMR